MDRECENLLRMSQEEETELDRLCAWSDDDEALLKRMEPGFCHRLMLDFAKCTCHIGLNLLTVDPGEMAIWDVLPRALLWSLVVVFRLKELGQSSGPEPRS